MDPDRIYLMGGSMGGTGVWKMASAYPYLFAAVMPVAGNPDTVDAALLANTPVYTVMGTGDNLMDIAPVTSFMERLKELNRKLYLTWKMAGHILRLAQRAIRTNVSIGFLIIYAQANSRYI